MRMAAGFFTFSTEVLLYQTLQTLHPASPQMLIQQGYKVSSRD